jgi:hypothetical protein
MYVIRRTSLIQEAKFNSWRRRLDQSRAPLCLD